MSVDCAYRMTTVLSSEQTKRLAFDGFAAVSTWQSN